MNVHPSCWAGGTGVFDNNAWEIYERESNLHTLHSGSLKVKVLEVKCPEQECGLLIKYDDADKALFRMTKEHIFTRILLDGLFWTICGTGVVFRDALFSWSSKSCLKSARYHRLGSVSLFARQRGNEAFTSFLMTLLFSNDGDIFSLLTCSECESTLEYGWRRMDGILMDGSAIGILGRVPLSNASRNL